MTDNNSSKLKKVARILAALFLLAISIAVLVALDVFNVGFAMPVIVPLLGMALFLLFSSHVPRSKYLKVFMPLFPTINVLTAHQEQLSRNRYVVEKMKYTLEFYKIYTIPDKVYNQLINSLPSVNTEEGRIMNCAKNLAEHLKPTQQLVSTELFVVLYHERHDLSITALWEREKAKLISGLAEVLLRSGRLLSLTHNVSYDKRDFEQLLFKFDDFKLDIFNAELNKISSICSRVTNYQGFLKKHGIQHQAVQTKITAMLDLLKAYKLPLSANILDNATLEILIKVGEESIQASHRTSEETLLKSCCLVSLAMFLTDNIEMRKTVCREASALDHALRLTFAYLEFREDLGVEDQLGGKDFVSVEYLIKNWAKRVKKRQDTLGKGFKKELRTIQEFLAEGEWLKRLPRSLERTYADILRESRNRQQLNDVLKERPWIQESLKRVFKNLTLETVERYLEARTINAYLLTFMVESGTVSGLLNCFILPEKQDALKKLGILLQVNGQAKYNFKQYTNHARIGIVPRGWSLERFYKAFQEDFLKVTKARRELVPVLTQSGKHEKKVYAWPWDMRDLKNIEVIVHRFGLSGRNYYGFISSITRPHAIQKIKELFADILNQEDLLSLIEYEEEVNVSEAIMQGTIIELVGSQVEFTDEEIKILEKQDESLRNGILEALGFRNVEKLAKYLLESNDQQRTRMIVKSAEALKRLLAEGIPEFDPSQCEMIAKAYLETLGAVASIGT